ncbi:biotin/lipoyl-containing protein [Bradyrhizobium sp. NC92]|uniref:biotin/lipoyl-containing protein n=1 Tax=Bradyrhizobium sp. (strain NC92) TaxID=55395 RepID=UPI0021AA1F48|nr:biotin/lipoyl-containing protein [Bradyrhizobium sp. NC92]UWU67708.1 HlyD family efflux transporter periplasmic adaptor subunit [Bradyrhizobium sp. NC92]
MKHCFEIDGIGYQLWLVRCKDGYRLRLDNGVIALLSFSHQGEGRGTLTIAGEREPVRFVVDGETIHLHMRGLTRSLRYRDPMRALASASREANHLMARAPIPGIVVSITISPGQSVSAGTPLMTIESMKLETTIRAPRDGVVSRIHFKEGESFERDALLVSLLEEGI